MHDRYHLQRKIVYSDPQKEEINHLIIILCEEYEEKYEEEYKSIEMLAEELRVAWSDCFNNRKLQKNRLKKFYESCVATYEQLIDDLKTARKKTAPLEKIKQLENSKQFVRELKEIVADRIANEIKVIPEVQTAVVSTPVPTPKKRNVHQEDALAGAFLGGAVAITIALTVPTLGIAWLVAIGIGSIGFFSLAGLSVGALIRGRIKKNTSVHPQPVSPSRSFQIPSPSEKPQQMQVPTEQELPQPELESKSEPESKTFEPLKRRRSFWSEQDMQKIMRDDEMPEMTPGTPPSRVRRRRSG